MAPKTILKWTSYPGGRAAWMRDHCVAPVAACHEAKGDMGEAVRGVVKSILEVTKDARPATTAEAMKVACKLIRDHFHPEVLGNSDPRLPKTPQEVQAEVNTHHKSNVDASLENPTQIRARHFIALVETALRTTLQKHEKKQVDTAYAWPRVFYLLNFLVGLRSNDLNPTRLRNNGDKAGKETHVLAEGDLDDHAVVCTLLNMLPSKQRSDKPKADSYATPFLTQDDSLIQRALGFIKDTAAPDKVPQQGGRLYGELFEEFHLEEAIVEWGSKTKEKRHLAASDGRHFAACCILGGLYESEGDLTLDRAMERALHHKPGSAANQNYKDIKVTDVEPVRGYLLKKVTPEKPLAGLTAGVALVLKK